MHVLAIRANLAEFGARLDHHRIDALVALALFNAASVTSMPKETVLRGNGHCGQGDG